MSEVLLEAQNLLKRGEYQRALNEFLTLINSSPSEVVYQGVIASFLGLKKRDEVLFWTQKWVSSFPSIENQLELIDLYEKLGLIDSLIQGIENLIEEVMKDHKGPLYFRLGNIYRSQKKLRKAIENYKKACSYLPKSLPVVLNLSQTYLLLEEQSHARQVYLSLAKASGGNAFFDWQAQAELLPKGILNTENDGDIWFQKALGLLEKQRELLPLNEMIDTINHLHLHPPLQARYYGNPSLYLKFKKAYSNAFYVDSGTIEGTGGGIGILIAPGQESSFIRAMSGLSQIRLESLIVICSSLGKQRLQKHFSFDYCVLEPQLSGVPQQLRALHLDLLYFWETGTHAWNYFLGYFRMAKKQVTSVGVPSSTGLPEMDVFISPDFYETPETQVLYSETLVLYPTVPLFLRQPQWPDLLTPYLNHKKACLCTQTLLKIHPLMDRAFQAILNQNPGSHLYFFEHAVSSVLTQKFKSRLEQILPMDRVHFLPRLDYENYLQVVSSAQVILDTFPVSGGLTTVDAIATGTPFVTLKGVGISHNLSANLYAQIQCEEGIADSVEEYIELASQFLNTPGNFREKMNEKRNLLFFDKKEMANQLHLFFQFLSDIK